MIAPTSTQQHIAISLSKEELYVVMRLLHTDTLPGFDLTWLRVQADGTLPKETQQSLEVATNALVARGYLMPDTNEKTDAEPLKIAIPAPVLSLVGACVFGEAMVVLSLQKMKGPSLTYLHELQGLGVVHTMPLSDIHLFEAIDGRADMLRVIDEALTLDKQSSMPLPAAKALAIDTQAARDAAIAGQREEALTLLLRGGLPKPTAQALAVAMQEATALGAITIVKLNANGEVQQKTLAVVVTPTTCFALSDIEGQSPTFYVQPTSAEALRDWAKKALL